MTSKSDEPFWNESFSFRAVDWASSVTLSVRDKINVKVRVLGIVQTSSAGIAKLPGMVCQSRFRLRDKSGEKRECAESEIEIELKVALMGTKKDNPSAVTSADAAEAERDDAGTGVIADQDGEIDEEAFARRKELKRQEREHKSTLYSNFSGTVTTSQTQVHVTKA